MRDEPLDWRRAKRAAGGSIEALIGTTSPVPVATVVPFPVTRRRAFITRLVGQVATRSPAVGEKHLAHQLRVQAETLRRKGVAERSVRREIAALEAAVRAELWRALFGRPSPRGRA